MSDYISAVVTTIVLSIPFVFFSDLIFDILQIPFALIHRYAARVVFVYKIYILCQFFSLLTNAYVQKYNVFSIVILLIHSVFLFFALSGAVRDARQNDHENGTNHSVFVSITSLIAIPGLWLIYYFDVSLLNQPVIWFLEMIKFLYKVPIIGDLLKFLTNAASGTAIIVFIIIIIIFLIVLFVKLFDFIRGKREN